MEYSLTNAQKSIWLTEKFYSGTAINNISGYSYISEEFELKILEKAINEVVKSNDAMRIKIKEEGNSCIQYISEYSYFDIETINLFEEKDMKVKALELSKIPFDIQDKTLFKFTLFKLPNNYGGFFLTAHHLIGDSWSLGSAVKQIMNTYAKLKNNTYMFENRPSYTSYIEAEKEYLDSDKFKKDKEYWNNNFCTVPETASIPSFKKSDESSCNGNRENFNFDINIVNKINDFCKENKISLYNFFMSVYSLYLGRVSSLDDFVIGTPILNRTNFEQKNTMGMFISTAPLRINLNQEISFIDFVKDISSNTISLFRHQKYPYQYLLEDLRKKDSSIPNLYNVILSYQITKTFDEEYGVKYIAEWVSNGCCADDLQVHLFDLNDEGNITVAYDYMTEKYDAQDISNLHARILTIIEQVISNNNMLLKNIEIVTPEEKHKILYEFNDTYADYPKDKTIVDLFEEQVKKTPNNVAVVFEDQQLTYMELNEKANQLARYLLDNNIKKSSIVGLYLNKSLEVIIGMFATLKCGATFLPLDTEYPQDRLDYILSNSLCDVILTSKFIENNLISKKKNICIDLVNSDIYSTNNTDNPKSKICSEDIMYVMYTSGSTGKPKGVMVKHKNIVRLAKYPNFIDLDVNENFVQTGTIVFDACIFEIFGALLHGFKLFIIKKENLLDLNYFSNFLKEKEITTLFLTTGLFNQFGIQNATMFSSLKNLLTGGDIISHTCVENIRKFCPNLNIINCYGPTENGSYSTCFKINDNYTTLIPIGTPITNSTAYVVSDVGSLCPIGVPGELWVGGNGVGKGYLNNPALTTEKFISNPFEDGIIYKTGDLVRWLTDGNIEFIGRIDNQVKVRGFRIELSEIDSNILTYPNIKQSISIVHNINNNKTICSYIVSNEQIDISKLKNHLSKTLASYMIPTYIIKLDKLPLNINDKVDRKALPIPSLEETNKENIPARNVIDEFLISSLENIIEFKNIGIQNSFFDIGGDSLSAISFSTSISNRFNSQITVKDIFEHPVIEDLSDYISSMSAKRSGNVINKVEKQIFYPVSSAQKRIYYSSIVDKNSTLYNIAGGLVLDNNLDINKLKTCFEKLITRHESLRTHIDIKDDELVQIIDENISFNLELENANTNDLNKIYSNFVKSFDLSKAPLFRTKLIKLENNKILFLLDMHHIISDGTSLNILMQELCDLYNGDSLSNKEIDYKDFTLWEQEQFNTKEFKNSKEYWLNQFKDEIPLLNMPTTYPRPSTQSFDGSNYYSTLDTNTYAKVNKLAKELNVTPYMLLLSVYNILLSKYTSQDDIVVGSPIVGRELPELSNMLGMFVNTLAIRNNVNHSLSFKDFSNSVKEKCLNCFRNQAYPFDMLVKELNITRDTSRTPLFDTMFIYQNNGYPEINLKDVSTEYFIPDNKVSKFDLSLEIIPVNNEYSIRFEYCTKLFDEDFIKRLSSHYINILNTILDNSDVKISDIDMLSEDEKNQILYEFNNTKVDYPKDKTIVDLFEEQVKKTPDNIAIVFEDKKLTYMELNKKANQLARYLLEQRVTNNSIVGIMLPRSLEIIISILAVLKSGACYIPIDPNFPKDRIEYMLGNSNASILIKNNTVKNIDFNKSIDVNNSYIYNFKSSNINLKISQDSYMYIIYTSGSTGKPKGVILKHSSFSNLVFYLNNNVEYFKDIFPNMSIASITTMSFDIFLFETIVSLQKGLKVIIANEKEQTNPTLLNELINKHDIKAIQMTPSRMEIFINNKEYMPHLSNLRYITLAGEALSLSLKNKILELGNILIYNGYGPSETTVFSTFTNATYQKNITIGKPISNTFMYVFDADRHLCPIGMPGELYVSGDGVGYGYINNPDLTAKSYITDPFNFKNIMYQTGDLVKLLPNGEFLYMGRKDNQVKIRGLRIELDEIQNCINKYSNINKSIVYACNDKNNRQYIVAYLTVTNRISINDLKMYLSKYIPKYMIPSYFVILNDFPYLPNGKINKKALPIPEKTLNLENKKYIAPTNKLEMSIIEIYEKLLSITPIGITDNFFEIGGDSLLAMSLQLELLKLHININYSDIFMYPSAKDLSSHILTSSHNSLTPINTNEVTKYDYILNNTLTLPALTYSKCGNILLAGVTGFLGAHLLDSFLKDGIEKIYCLIRPEAGLTIEQKLLNKLHYYFENEYDELIGNRIMPINADISVHNLGLSEEELLNISSNIDIVVNSAAKVSHYGNYSEYKSINVDGTQNLIDFCLKNNKRLYQISTLSVSGNSFVDTSYIQQNFKDDIEFHENNFYIGQSLDNVYIRSKFEAEKLVLDNILCGLDGYILRVGNLMNRFSDGKFQPNVNENAYINRLIAYFKVGCIPDYLTDAYLELTPIDYCANAILKIIQYNSKTNRIFHLLNHKNVDILYFIKILNKFYNNINIVSNDEFLRNIDKILNNPDTKNILSGLINDFDQNRKLIYSSPVKIKSNFTVEYLEKCEFTWPSLTEEYIIKFLKFFSDLKFFEK